MQLKIFILVKFGIESNLEEGKHILASINDFLDNAETDTFLSKYKIESNFAY